MASSDTRESFLESLLSFSANNRTHYNQTIENLFPKGSASFEGESDQNIFINAFMRNLRFFLEKQMIRSITGPTTFYNDDTKELLRFTFWCAQKGIINEMSPFIMVEDVYDCLSISEILTFFDFLEELVTSITSLQKNQQNALLRIGNAILKKFSKAHENDFRGRVQLFLAKITELTHVTAVNLKSTINPNNTTTFESNHDEKDSMSSLATEKSKNIASRVSFSFYKKFWELQKFLHNPNLLFNEDSTILIFDDILDEEVTEITQAQANSA
jgi:hypothetical protein